MKESGEFPRSIIIEPTDKCNLSCSYCPRRSMKDKLGFMDYGLYTKLIDEINHYPDRELVLFHRGESLLHPQFLDMVRYAEGRVGKILLATNGTLLTPEISHALSDCVDFLSFSIDLPDRFASVRGGDYAVVKKNIDYFISINRHTETQVSMVMTDGVSASDVDEFEKLWRDKVDKVRVYVEHSKNEHFGSIEGSNFERKTCIKPFRQTVISWDGSIRRCNHDWDGCPLGNVGTTTIKEVWKSQEYTNLRSEQLSLKNLSEPCNQCDSWYDKGGK